MNIFRKILPFIFIIILSFFAYKPLLNPGFFPIHDNTQVARVFEMTKSLKDGMFPVRWVADLGYGYGYPIFNYYDPLPYYAGAVFGILGFDFLFSTKLIMLLGIIFAGLFMYLLAKEFWGKLGGILSALFYVYAPYHAVDIYVRGDVAEFWAYAFIPLLFYGLWRMYLENKWRHVVIASISYAFIILSHNLTAVILSPFVLVFIIYLIFLKRRKIKQKQIIMLFLPLLIGILISAFYILPAIFEINYTNVFSLIGGGSDFRNNFVCLTQLWTGTWGFGGSVEGCADGLSFMIGKYHIVLSIILFAVSSYILFSKKYSKKFEKERNKLLFLVFSFSGLLVASFFTLEISRPIWELINIMSFLQYPWRFLIMVVFFASFICGSLLWYLEKFMKSKRNYLLLSIFIFIVFIILSAKFFVPQKVLNQTSSELTSDYALKWITSKTSDEYMPKSFSKPGSYFVLPNIKNLVTKDLKVEIISKKTQELNLKLTVYRNNDYILPVAYFPAWTAQIDGENLSLKEDKRGILVNFPKGDHRLLLSFKQTPVEKLANFLSIAGILSVFAGIIYKRAKHE